MTSSSAPRVSPEAFVQTMSRVAGPVAVVTALDDGRAHGTTVSAFCSLSLDPPLIMAALDGGSDLLQLVKRTERFGISVMSERQHAIAMSCAKKGRDKMAALAWTERRGVPIIDHAVAWLACETHSLVPGGDHTIVVGEVLECGSGDGEALVYCGRQFCSARVLRQDELEVRPA